MNEIVPKVSVPMNFGIHLLNSPTHNTLPLEASQGAVVRASPVILSLNSPKIDHMTTTLHLTSVDMKEFPEKAVRSFVEAAYTGSLPPISRDMFRDLHKMAHVFEVTWLVAKCVQRFCQIADTILQPSYPDLLFLFEEAAFVLSKLKCDQLQDIALKKIASLNWREQFIRQYLQSSDHALSEHQLDMIIELAGSEVNFVIQPLTDTMVASLGVSGASMPPNCRYLLQHCNLFLYRQRNTALFEQLFDLLQEVSSEVQEDINWIFRLYRSCSKKALVAATEPATTAAIPPGGAGPSCETAGDIEVGIAQSSPRDPNPSLLHTLDCNKSFDEMVDWLGESDEVVNMLMFIEDLYTWMLTNTSTVIKCTSELLDRFTEIKERRKWRAVPIGYIYYNAYLLTPSTGEFFAELTKCTDLCCPEIDKTQWAWVRWPGIRGVSVNTLFGQETRLVFLFKHPAVENCSKSGVCGFVLKLTPAKDGGDIQLCTEPSDYCDDIHFHDEVKTGTMHLYAVICNDEHKHFCWEPLTWLGRPRVESDGVHWGPHSPADGVKYIDVIISL